MDILGIHEWIICHRRQLYNLQCGSRYNLQFDRQGSGVASFENKTGDLLVFTVSISLHGQITKISCNYFFGFKRNVVANPVIVITLVWKYDIGAVQKLGMTGVYILSVIKFGWMIHMLYPCFHVAKCLHISVFSWFIC